MYRLLLFTSILIFGECCFPKFPKAPCHWSEGTPNQFEAEARYYFEENADFLYQFDRMSNTFCYLFGENEMQVHSDSYKLYVATPENSGPYNVSRRHTVLFIRGSGTGCSSLSHMKILPPYVDFSKLSWKHQNNTIVVTVPFSRTDAGYKKCPFTKEYFSATIEATGRSNEKDLLIHIDETKV